MTSPRRIVFLGTHGQRNIGDELLLETFLAQLGSEHHYVVNTYDPGFTAAQLAGRYDVKLVDTAKDRLRLLRELLRSDVLCFGGGSIVKELYASTGRHRYSTLVMILALVTFTRWVARKPIAMLNVGVGPLRSPGGLRLARMILSQVDLLTVRDEKSLGICASLGVAAAQVTDAVFSASPSWLLGGDDARESAGAAASGPLRIALNLNFDIENPDNWELFLDRLAQALTIVNERHPLEIHCLPMQNGFKEHDDAEVLDSFAERVPTIVVHRHVLADHGDVAALVESVDLVISERFHAIVIASILGVPSLVLAYDVKVQGLAEMLGLSEWSVDINEPFIAIEVADQLLGLIDQRDAVALQVRERSGELEAEASRDFGMVREWIATARR